MNYPNKFILLALTIWLVGSFQIDGQTPQLPVDMPVFDLEGDWSGDAEPKKIELRNYLLTAWSTKSEVQFVVYSYTKHGGRITSTLNVERRKDGRMKITEETLGPCPYISDERCRTEKPVRTTYENVEFIRLQRDQFVVLMLAKENKFRLF